MMKAVVSIFIASSLCATINKAIETRYVSVNTLTRESLLKASSEIFTPQTSVANKNAEHSVHVSDKQGRFMKLDFSAEHTDGEFFKIDESPHNDSIIDIDCNDDSLTTPNMIVTFIDDTTADNYYDYIDSISDKRHFIIGSHLWLCRNYETIRYAPILREILNVTRSETNDDQLIIRTKYAKYTDIFLNLEFQFETNMKVHDKKFERKSILTGNERRLLSWSTFWSDITDGITEFVENVVSFVSDIVSTVWSSVEDVIEALAGDSLAIDQSENYTTSFEMDLSGNYIDNYNLVYCTSCYANFDLVFKYELHIQTLTLTYFTLQAGGNVNLSIEIDALDSYSNEYVNKTSKLEVPELSFDIFGVTFTFDLFGKIAVGADIGTELVMVGAHVYGNVTYGIEYTSENGVNYINDQSFSYDITGPELQYATANLDIYIRPTMSSKLDYIGSVYFGLQAQASFTLTENTGSSDCVIDYTPTAKVTSFVGGTLAPFNITIWNGSTQVSPYQATLTTFEGCITQSDIATYEISVSSDVEEDIEGTTTSSTVRRLRRRRLTSKNGNFSKFGVNYQDPNTLAYTKAKQLWGKTNNEWWGNLTNAVCKNGGHNHVSSERLPDVGSLLLRVIKAKQGQIQPVQMIGVYETTFYNYTLNNGQKTTLQCLTRLNFTEKNSTVYRNAPNFSFRVKMLEYYCDVYNTSLLDINETFLHMISLDSSMNAISGGPHFRTIYLYDTDSYCESFVLSKQFGFDLEAYSNSSSTFAGTGSNEVKQKLATTFADSSHGWFGTYHCGTTELNYATLYFQTFDVVTNNFTVFMKVEYDTDSDGELDGSGGDTWMYGVVDWTTNMLCLRGKNNKTLQILQMCGVLTLLEDGALYYTGNVSYGTKHCDGFILKGYFDVDSIEGSSTSSALNVDTSDGGDSSSSSSNNSESVEVLDSTSFVYGILAGMAICLASTAMIVLVMCKCMGYEFTKVEQKGNYTIMDA